MTQIMKTPKTQVIMTTHSKLALMGLMVTALSGCVESDFERGFVIEQPQQIEIESCNKEPSYDDDDVLLTLGWLLEKKGGEIPSDLSDEEKNAYIKQGLKLYEARASSPETDDETKAKAYGRLSVYYINKKDYRKAIKSAFCGVEKGSNVCAEGLYICYMTGRGVVQDYEEAIKWKYVAAALGNERCQSLIMEDMKNSVNNRILAQRLEEGRLRAKNWEFKHPDLFFCSKVFEWETSLN